jgi:CheY-like chemotaxis protein
MLAYAGKSAIVFKPVDLNEVVMETEHLIRSSISKMAELVFHLTREIPAVEGDATQLRQVIMNLVINASEALGDQEGVIKIATGTRDCISADLASDYLVEEMPAGRYVFMEISDSGSGMDESTRAKIFDPFFTTKFTGRGLGLSAVLGIIRSHRGTIKVDTVEGRGSTFTVLVPVSDRPSVEELHDDDGAEQQQGAGTILVVDDEKGVRMLARHHLQEAGFDVLEAEDGRRAVEVFHERSRDLVAVLLDLTLPGLSGAEVFREMQAHDPDVPIVLTSGYPEHQAMEILTGEIPAAFIHKPWDGRDLIKRMLEVLPR